VGLCITAFGRPRAQAHRECKSRTWRASNRATEGLDSASLSDVTYGMNEHKLSFLP
jgi:hypothetical protein